MVNAIFLSRGRLAILVAAALVAGLMAVLFVGPRFESVSANLSQTGRIVGIFPSQNSGTSLGAGQIQQTDKALSLGYFVFQTPQDVVPGNSLHDGNIVCFEPLPGKLATKIALKGDQDSCP